MQDMDMDNCDSFRFNDYQVQILKNVKNLL